MGSKNKKTQNLGGHMVNKGFTITELAIVILVIAVITGSILGGAAIIDSAKVVTVVKEHGVYQEVFTAFKDKYNQLPGDMTNASDFWGSAVDGDGNMRIVWAAGSDPNTEGVQAWYQIDQAGMIEEAMTGSAASDVAVSGTNVPLSALSAGNIGWFVDYDASYPIGTAIGLGRSDGVGMNDTSALTADISRRVDKKLDDGAPSSGNVRGIGGSCITGSIYDIAGSDAETCVMRFGLHVTIHNRDLN